MERLPDGTIEEILSFRNQVIQEANAISLSSEHDADIMEDRSFIGFLDALNYTGFVENFDYMAWMQQRNGINSISENEAENSIANMVEEVKNADMEELRKLITMHIRIERFSEGHIQKLYEEGFFNGFFDRLEELNNG